MNVQTFFQTPGIGGAVAITVIAILVACYGLTVRWIAKGQADQSEGH